MTEALCPRPHAASSRNKNARSDSNVRARDVVNARTSLSRVAELALVCRDRLSSEERQTARHQQAGVPEPSPALPASVLPSLSTHLKHGLDERLQHGGGQPRRATCSAVLRPELLPDRGRGALRPLGWKRLLQQEDPEEYIAEEAQVGHRQERKCQCCLPLGWVIRLELGVASVPTAVGELAGVSRLVSVTGVQQ